MRIDNVVTSGLFKLDGGEWEVDNNVWIVGDDSEVYIIDAAHNAGIGVCLDVVYNHTAEGNHNGPTISFRGIDNAAYYRLVDDDPQHYMDYTGTGNSLNVRDPHSLQMIMDSLRYWITEMHVDGFRFDLGTILAREVYGFDEQSGFLKAVNQDPLLATVKLIAEPWDVGPGGYQVGNFPQAFTHLAQINAVMHVIRAEEAAKSGHFHPAHSTN